MWSEAKLQETLKKIVGAHNSDAGLSYSKCICGFRRYNLLGKGGDKEKAGD